MNLILCGMMGSGKTTVGMKIAQLTGRRWVDTDDFIVEKHGTISGIFQQYGEPYFRALERETVKLFSIQDGLVISTGGGVVLDEENVTLLKRSGRIIFLRATVDCLSKRLKSDETRPLLQSSESIEERLKSLLQTRAPIYERIADYVVDVDNKTPESIAKEIINLSEKE